MGARLLLDTGSDANIIDIAHVTRDWDCGSPLRPRLLAQLWEDPPEPTTSEDNDRILNELVLKRIEELKMDTLLMEGSPLTSGGQKQMLNDGVMNDIGKKQLPPVEAGRLPPPNICQAASTCSMIDAQMHHMVRHRARSRNEQPWHLLTSPG